MKRKGKFFGNIFYIFFAFCFLGAGIFTITRVQTNSASAEDTSYSQPITNNVPAYFAVKDRIGDEHIEERDDPEIENPSSLMSENTFLYFEDGGKTSQLELSLAMNGISANIGASTGHDVYQYVYYPNPDDLSLFYFYNIGATSLYYNGATVSLDEKNFVQDCGGQSFANNPATLQGFKMTFKAGATRDYEIDLKDEDGNIKEGVYTLTLTITLYTCTDGGTTDAEEKFSDQNIDITYSFYVAEREKYLLNYRPNVNRFQFDSEVPISDATSATYAYYLYYNYSSKGAGTVDANKIPYIQYDFTRFELTISKDVSNITTQESVLFDKDTKDVVTTGEDIITVRSDPESNLCKVFFTDVGNYSVAFNDIQVIDFADGEGKTTLQKNDLSAVTRITKRFMVYVYGYQANYTDADGALDENGSRPTEELKGFDFKAGTFSKSADITSDFLNSQESYAQSDGTTFVIRNIVGYIGSKKAQRTNQTPVKIASNATLSTSIDSYIYSTTQVSNAYTESTVELNGQKLYWTRFTGRTESTAGTYIYVIAYTFNNFYTSDTTLSNQVFFQVFYFEIVKDLPKISLQTEKVEESDQIKDVYSDTFVNKNVKITDLTQEDPYNKDVTIRVYAQDFGGNYMQSFGGTSGVTFANLSSTGDPKIRILEDNAHYTIRMYFASEMNGQNINISSDTGYFREQKFTIDKTPITNITATNVSSITNSSDFTILQKLNVASTNQNIIVSWDEKASGAETFAYYRYFALDDGQYYSTTSDSSVSSTLEQMLNMGVDDSYLPVNAFLNMSTSSSLWLKYKGNSKPFINPDGGGIISSEYVFTEAGLYIVDVYDSAGNHSVDVYIIDYTTPIFAIFEESYKIVTASVYISQASTLYWSKYKGIYIQNFNRNCFIDYNSETVTKDILEGDTLFNTYDGKTSKEIYDAIYNKLVSTKYMQELVCRTETTGSDLSTYTGMYLTIPVNPLSYYNDTDDYRAQTGVFSKVFSMDEELTYSVLIRDASNTKLYAGFDETSVMQYKNYYSATQTIIISFDSSDFLISYENAAGESIPLTSNNVEEGIFNGDETRRTKTTYLNPTRLNRELFLSFYPTVTDGDITIQVGLVTIKYYPYVEGTKTVSTGDDEDEGQKIVYHYYELSDEPTTTTIYEYNGDNPSTELKRDSIRLNSDNVTTAGRYEITRRYYVDDEDSSKEYYNTNDFFERTFILTVDRNEVVSNPDLVTDENGNHLESLVGGDVFVSMYDNKQNASLVVTFPNSPEGNTNGSSIYNNANPRTVLTTNMLPVFVYIPQYKYTTSAQMTTARDSYDFKVDYDFDRNGQQGDSMNFFKEDSLIKEYALYAEIYRNETIERINANAATPYAKTATNGSGTLSAVVANANGFLNFYLANGSKIDYLSQAGTYYVKLYQGNFGTGIGDNNYTQALTFGFVIEQTNPDFEAHSADGSTLNSQQVNGRQTYYTNQPTVTLTWQAGSDYIADIDIDEITFETSVRSAPYKATDNIWSKEPTLENGVYTAQLNLELLGIYSNNAYVDITMQYKNHDDRFYSKVKKRVAVDLSAPNTNIQNLVNNATASGYITALTTSSLRIYRTALGQTTSDLNNTSYNTSNNTGNFQYYSYSVTSAFANTLKNSVDFKTYIGKFENADGECTKYNSSYEQEISPDNFHASDFVDISDRYFTQFDAGCYYQVIETDRAGNMTIYTIYITNYEESEDETQNRLITYYDSNRTLQYYSIADYNEAKRANATHNIYTKTSSQLQSINYFGDAWAQFELTTYSATGVRTVRRLMLTPWDTTHAYAFVGGRTEILDISSLIDTAISLRYKNSFTFFNRENLTRDTFYMNIRNVTLPASLTDTQTREYIRFDQPTDAQLNDALSPQTFVTSLKITANEDEIFNATNRLGLSSIWTTKQNANISISVSSGYITFEVNSSLGFAPNTRIVYEYTDNYGTTLKEIHLYRETVISTEIASENDLYAYYNTSGQLHYITRDGFEYFYNPSKYIVNVYDFVDGEVRPDCQNADVTPFTGSDGITVITIKTKKDKSYRDCFAIKVLDFNDSTNEIKTIYVELYNELPTPNTSTEGSATGENNKPGEFKLLDASRNNVTSTIIADSNFNDTGYFSEITLLYSNKTTFIPIKYSISTDRQHWTEVASGTVLKNETDKMMTYYLKVWYDETYMENELANADYLFSIVPQSQIYAFNLSSLTSTYWVEKTVNNVTSVVEKSNTIYTVKDAQGRITAQYSNHYIVNVDYYTNSDAVQIKTNTEQQIVPHLVRTYETEDGIASQLWTISNADSEDLGNIPPFTTNIVISYIPAKDNFVTEFYTYSNTNGIINNTENSENLIGVTAKKFVVSAEYQQLDKIELKWTKYYGIEQNEILIRLVKDGINLNPTVYSKMENNKSYNYIYLKNSGKYIIMLYDMSGNVQKFNSGNTGQSDTLTFIFLKDVPFTVISTDPSTGEEVRTMPIKQAVYNGQVTLSIDKGTRSEFYASGGYPAISVKRNGTALTNEQISREEIMQETSASVNYVFTTSGFYEVSFSATSDDSYVGAIRSETYQFTVLNANEYKYSYIINKYSNYYIERVEKDGNDITDRLLRTLNVGTIRVGTDYYMTELPLSYLDDKTGTGRYLITVNSNDSTFKTSSMPTSWTFAVTIQVGNAPIRISVAEGKKTTKRVTVEFNTENIFAEMGECTVRIVKYDDKGRSQGVYENQSIAVSSASSGTANLAIEKEEDGTFFLQIVSPSGNILYSYKILKKEPMNPATIIIIVVAVVLAVVVIIIIVKLRKRISVK